MSKYTSLQSYTEHNAQIVPMPEVPAEEAKTKDDCADLEAKLAWINDKVPLKEGNIMGSQAGAGSGDFHMYRMARRREQFRWARVEEEDVKRKEEDAFVQRKKQRETETESKTAKNRLKRNKRKGKQQAKTTSGEGSDSRPEGGGDEEDDADEEERAEEPGHAALD